MSLWSTRTVGLFTLNTVWPDTAVVPGRIRKVCVYKSGQRSVTSLSSHYWSPQSCCSHFVGSQAHSCAVLAVQSATSLTQSRGSGNTYAQDRGRMTPLCGLTCWPGGRRVLHGIPGTSRGFHRAAKLPEPGLGCQAETSVRTAVPLWLPLTGLKVPHLQANPNPPLLESHC